MRPSISRSLAAAALATLALAAARDVAGAQGLPAAPSADKAVTAPAPPTGAKASLPGEGGSPLEPWLVTWLLPVSGLLAVGVATATDRRVRASGGRRSEAPSRR